MYTFSTIGDGIPNYKLTNKFRRDEKNLTQSASLNLSTNDLLNNSWPKRVTRPYLIILSYSSHSFFTSYSLLN